MKKLVLFLFSILITHSSIDAQTSDNPIVIAFDFKTKKFECKTTHGTLDKKTSESNRNWIKRGDFFQLKVNSINMNLYNISFDKRDSIVMSDITFPSFEMLGLDAINGIVESFVGNTSSTTRINKDVSATIDSLKIFKEIKALKKDELKGLELKITDTKALKSKYNSDKSIDNQINTLEFKRDILIVNLKDIDSKIIIYEKRLAYFNDQLDSLKSSPKLSIETLVNENTKELNKLNENAQNGLFQRIDSFMFNLNIQVLAYQSSNTDEPSQYLVDPKLTFKTIVDSAKSFRTQLESYKGQISGLYEQVDSLILAEISLQAELKKDTLLRKKVSDFKTQVSKSTEVFAKNLEELKQDKIMEYLKGLIYLENNVEREYVSMPMQFSGDISEIKISIMPKKPEFGPSYSAQYFIPLRRFYTGIGGSFYYAPKFGNDYYSTREIQGMDSTSQYQLVNEKTSRLEYGIAALLHVGGKICGNWLGIHGSVGPAVSLEAKPQARLSLGCGFSIGNNRNMVTVDYLRMAGYVQRISAVYDESTLYSAKPEQVTISKLKTSYSFAIGYIYKF